MPYFPVSLLDMVVSYSFYSASLLVRIWCIVLAVVVIFIRDPSDSIHCMP